MAEAKANPIRDKSFAFAVSVVRLCKHLNTAREFVISKQLLRSGTSIGANIEEATAAVSRRDFLYRMTIASKESREALYWLKLLQHSDLIHDLDVSAEISTAKELVRMLTAIVRTTSGRLNQEQTHPNSDSN